MKNKEDVLQKIEKIRNDGPNKLQVITDYDKTITKQHINGQCVHNSWGNRGRRIAIILNNSAANNELIINIID